MTLLPHRMMGDMTAKRPSPGERPALGNSSRLKPPKRGGRLCERRELLSSLDETLQTRVTLIIAHAGYGKTTLISQWCQRLDQQQIPVAYYAASQAERDPSAFLAMVAAAMVESGIDLGEHPPFIDGRIREDITVEDILLGLELAGQTLILIIDDFERVNEPAIAAMVASLIELAPASIHFVIASRVFPAFPVSALQLEGKLRLIDSYQLRLRHEELAWMLELDADSAEVKEVAVRTQGWPVTAELYRLWRKRYRTRDTRQTFGSHVEEVHNYLAEQLFSSLPPEQFELLIDIADRDEASAELVDAMRERNDSARLLHIIAHNISSLMWTGQENNTTVYRLHPLLLEHLRQTLSQDVARRTRLAINASRWFFEQHRFPEAIRAALDSRDTDTVEHVIRALRPIHIVVADGAPMLRAILRELPESFCAQHPRLQIMAAIVHFKAGFFVDGRAMLERIREQTHGFTVDAGGQRDWLLAEGNLIDLIFFCQMSRMSGRVEALIDVVIGVAGGDATIRGACEIVMMLVHQIRGDLDAADAAMARGRTIYDTVQLSRYGHTQIVGHEVLVLMARGRLRKSLELIARYQKQSDFEVPDDISTPTLLKLMLATIRYEQEFSDSAVDAMKHALAQHSITESWFDQYAIVYPALAVRLWMSEGGPAVLAFLEDARQRAQRRGLEALPDFLTCLEIEYRARMGDVAVAEKLAADFDLGAHANPVGVLAETLGWREREAALNAALRLAIAQRAWDAALALARSLTRAGQSGGRLKAEIKGHVFCALIEGARGGGAAAASSLLKAVLLAYPEGFVAPFSEEGTTLDASIEALMTENIDAYARRHLETIRRAIGSSMARPDSELLNLREREIVGHLAEGLSNKVIARRMGITDHTVKFHLKKIFSKLEVSRRRDAVAKILAGKRM
ncbi:MAG: LuxR family transcriptional regulator, maltose regulon positive regulatory protein [Gammaproteobacteria bacterium]|nr:LuxR family transcriptional regulator, maltose regulon positive regulatory protein [Gammaproteobacteria bacterium]